MNTLVALLANHLPQTILLASLLALGLLVLLALRTPHLARIAMRNVPRRWLRTGLIVFGLMLATTFVAAALAVDDSITLAVRSVAVFNLGRIDEQVTSKGGTPLHTFPASTGDAVREALAGDPHVAGVAPALVVPNLLLEDVTARQVRGGVTGLGLVTDIAGPLGDLRTAGGLPAPTQALPPTAVYLNRTTAQLLNAHVGDSLYMYSDLWPGRRYRFQVRGIVTGGLLGDSPSVVLPLNRLQELAGAQDAVNRIYVANAGDGLTGVAYSDEIADRVRDTLPGPLTVTTVKRDGIAFAQRAEDVFSRILTLFTLFALAIGLLLIFLIFVLLAAERRAELGMARALGMRRSHIVRMLMFEGAAYDVAAALVGLLVGLALGIAIVALMGPTIARLGFPIRADLRLESMILAFCLGFIFTLVTIVLAAWTVSRMTVAAALRDLTEPPDRSSTMAELIYHALLRSARGVWAPGPMLVAWCAVVWGVIVRGLVPLVLGTLLIRSGLDMGSALIFSAGASVTLAGLALGLRGLVLGGTAWWVRRTSPRQALASSERVTRVADRASAIVIGAGLALYWSLPFDALRGLGLSRFSGGVEIFFVAGILMVFGAVWALGTNLDLALAPLQWLGGRVGRFRHVTRVALTYPGYHRFRTGVGLALFTLVCFTMVVMACIAASTSRSYDDLPGQAAGYDIAGQPLFAPVGDVARVSADLRGAMPQAAQRLSAVSAATPLPLGIVQPGAPNAGWRFYPASVVQGAFLDGVGLPLVARSGGFTSDAAVWQAVRQQPGSVVIDVGALSGGDAAALGVTLPPGVTAAQFIGPPIAAGLPGLSSLESLGASQVGQSGLGGNLAQLGALAGSSRLLREYALRLSGVVTGRGNIASTPLWAADLRGGHVTKLTVVGLVDNARGQRYGLFGSPATFAPVEAGLPAFGNQYYYFKVRPGVDAHTEALAIGSALRDNGFETTVLQDVLLDVYGPRVFISRVVVGLVGLTLLVGMAALAVTGSRAVVERRQQIGMLRALGFRGVHVQAIFLLESLLVGAVGTALGLALGLVLCRNVFAVDFFETFQSGLVLVIPWGELAAICGAGLAASLMAALLPAWQAGHVTPADALRYE